MSNVVYASKVGHLFLGIICLSAFTLLVFVIWGYKCGFEYKFYSKEADTIGEFCKLLVSLFVFSCGIVAFCVRYISRNIGETDEIMFGKNSEKDNMRIEYVLRKKKEDVDFDIYKYVFDESK